MFFCSVLVHQSKRLRVRSAPGTSVGPGTGHAHHRVARYGTGPPGPRGRRSSGPPPRATAPRGDTSQLQLWRGSGRSSSTRVAVAFKGDAGFWVPRAEIQECWWTLAQVSRGTCCLLFEAWDHMGSTKGRLCAKQDCVDRDPLYETRGSH